MANWSNWFSFNGCRINRKFSIKSCHSKTFYHLFYGSNDSNDNNCKSSSNYENFSSFCITYSNAEQIGSNFTKTSKINETIYYCILYKNGSNSCIKSSHFIYTYE